MFGLFEKTQMITPEGALTGRADPLVTADRHAVFDRPLSRDIPAGMEVAMIGMGCFWGVERVFWQLPGMWMTIVGYGGGYTPNPTYEEVCSGKTGHNEVVRLTFDPSVLPYEQVLRVFWENHDPTQGMRQGNDRGTQYRSGLYVTAAQRARAEASRDAYAARLRSAGYGAVTTEIVDMPEFYHAEGYHQQYLHKTPDGYCGIGGTGVSCPIGLDP